MACLLDSVFPVAALYYQDNPVVIAQNRRSYEQVLFLLISLKVEIKTGFNKPEYIHWIKYLEYANARLNFNICIKALKTD